MLCEICRKNKATFHMTEVNTNKNLKRELHICEECAHKKGILQKVHLSINEMLGKPEVPLSRKDEIETMCGFCGHSLSDFKQTMRFGCPQDYEVFKHETIQLLERIHGSTKYVGKHPKNIEESGKLLIRISELERELEELVKNEDFENAAKVRDEIKKIKTKLQEKKDGTR